MKLIELRLHSVLNISGASHVRISGTPKVVC